jgi:hypothetical protein
MSTITPERARRKATQARSLQWLRRRRCDTSLQCDISATVSQQVARRLSYALFPPPLICYQLPKRTLNEAIELWGCTDEQALHKGF